MQRKNPIISFISGARINLMRHCKLEYICVDLARSITYATVQCCPGDPLVIDKWFRAQARSDLPDQVERVAELLNHPAFSLKNPNRLRSLVFTFASLNPLHFHRSDGKGYELLANVILEVSGHSFSVQRV